MRRPTNHERNRQLQERFLAEFRKVGVVPLAAKALGYSPTLHYRWLKMYPDYAAEFERLRAECERTGVAGAHRQRPGMAAGTKITSGARAERRQQRKRAFLALLAGGETFVAAARAAGVTPPSVYQWMADDPDFHMQVQAVRKATAPAIQERAAQKKRESLRRLWDSPGADARRRRLSEQKRALWEQPGRREAQSQRTKAQWDSLTSAQRAERLRPMRGSIKGGARITALEVAVMEHLNECGVPYQVHKVVETYCADVWIPSVALDIECDGDFHHAEGAAEEEARDAVLCAAGVTVLRLTEQEIVQRQFGRLDAILRRSTR